MHRGAEAERDQRDKLVVFLFRDGLAFLALALVFDAGCLGVTLLHTFTGGSDGSFPYAGLIADKEGALYGTTQNGGSAGGYGTVFKLPKKRDWLDER